MMRRVWSITLAFCIITPFVQTASTEEEKKGVGGYFKLKPSKGKDKAGSSSDSNIVVGIFKSTGAAFTNENCQANCKTHFGDIVSKDGNRIPFALPSLSSDKKTCTCLLNAEQIKDYLVVQKRKYENFLPWIKHGTFCSARMWFSGNHVDIEIPYEMEAKKLKLSSPKAKSPDRSPQKAAETSKEPTGTGKGKAVAGTSQAPAGTAKDKGAVESSKGSTETAQKAEEASSKIIVGAFTSTGSDFTPESCKLNCRTAFGYLIPYPGNKLPLTQPSVSADGKTCSCLVNFEPIRDWCIEKNRNYKLLFDDFQKFYCAGKLWFEDQFLEIELAYEMGIRPKKTGSSPDAGSSKGPSGPAKDAGTSKGAAGSKKGVEEATAEPKVLMGTVSKSKLPFSSKTVTIEDCKQMCNKKFGFIAIYPKQLLAFTVPGVSADGKGCDCFLNEAPIEEYFIARGFDFVTFLFWAKKSYADAVKHLAGPNMNLKVEFESTSSSKKKTK